MNVRVVEKMQCRVMLKISDNGDEEDTLFSEINHKDATIKVATKRGDTTFEYSSIYIDDSKEAQQSLDKETKPLVEYFLKGGNISCVCYGQKGLGKSSFLWEGEQSIVQRIVNRVLNTEDHRFERFEFVAARVSNENVIDLLRDNQINHSTNTSILSGMQNSNIGSFLEPTDLYKGEFTSFEDFLDLYSKSGEELSRLVDSRTVSYTGSHLVYEVRGFHDDGNECRFIIADLASAERVRKSVYLGNKLVECVEKSTSLVAFSKCISFLVEDKRDNICFEESRLTVMLKEALGGNCMTFFVVAVSSAPEDRERTLASLVFARRLRQVYCKRNLLVDRNPSRKTLSSNQALLPNYSEDVLESTSQRSWLGHFNELVSDNDSNFVLKTELKQAKKRNSVLESQLLEMEKMLSLKNVDQSMVSVSSTNKNNSFLSMGDASMGLILTEQNRNVPLNSSLNPLCMTGQKKVAYESIISDLREKIYNLENRLQDQSELLTEKDKLNKRLSEENKTAKLQLETNLINYEEDKQILEEQIESLSKGIREKIDMETQLEKQLAVQQNHSQQELRIINNEKHQLSIYADEADAKIAELVKRLKETQEQLKVVRDERDQIQHENELLKEEDCDQVVSLEKQLQTTENHLKLEKSKSKHLEKRLSDEIREVQSLKNKIDNSFQSVSQDAEALLNLESFRMSNEKLFQENLQLREKLHQLSTNEASYKEKIQRLTELTFQIEASIPSIIMDKDKATQTDKCGSSESLVLFENEFNDTKKELRDQKKIAILKQLDLMISRDECIKNSFPEGSIISEGRVAEISKTINISLGNYIESSLDKQGVQQCLQALKLMNPAIANKLNSEFESVIDLTTTLQVIANQLVQRVINDMSKSKVSDNWLEYQITRNRVWSELYLSLVANGAAKALEQESINIIKKKRTARMALGAWRRHKRVNNLKKLKQMHHTNYQMFQAGIGKFLLQNYMHRCESAFLNLFDGLEPGTDDKEEVRRKTAFLKRLTQKSQKQL